VLQDTQKWFHTDGVRSRTEGDKNVILKEILATESVRDCSASEAFGRKKKVYSIPGTTVTEICADGMKRILGTSNNKWNNVKNGTCDLLDESVSSHIKLKTEKEELIYRYLKTLRDLDSEYLPNEDAYDLPSNMLLSEIIRMFQVRDDVRHLSISKVYFLKIWQVFVFLLMSMILLMCFDQNCFRDITKIYAFQPTASFPNVTHASKQIRRKESSQMKPKKVSNTTIFLLQFMLLYILQKR
jgi:hypothetical protein